MKAEEKKPEQRVITRTFPGMENLSSLARAALQGDKATIERLLFEGSSLEELAKYRDKEGNTLLMYAVENGSLEGVHYLLTISEIQLRINTKNADGLTALHIAAWKGFKDILGVLREAGATTTDKELAVWYSRNPDKYGTTLLMYAVEEGSLEGVHYLLTIPEIIAQINTEKADGCTALHVAACKGYKDIVEILRKALRAFRADRESTVEGRAAVAATAQFLKRLGVVVQDEEDPITDKGLSMWRDTRGNTLLMRAVAEGSLEGVHYLLTIPEIKAEINEKNNAGLTALHIAAWKGYKEIIEVLRKAEAITTDEELAEYRYLGDNTLLIFATYERSLEGLHYLLTIPKIKAEINTQNDDGLTALQIAACKGYKDIVDILKKQGVVDTDKELVEYREKKDGNTLLIMAALNGFLEGVEYLLTIPGIKAEINAKNENGYTALHAIAFKGYKELIEVLRKAGATTTDEDLAEYRDKGGNTLLVAAALNGSLEGVQYLLTIPTLKETMNRISRKGDQSDLSFLADSLLRTSSSNSFEIIKCLLASGAYLTPIPDFFDVLDVSASLQTNPTYIMLKAAFDLLKLASGENITETLSELLEARASVHQRDSKGNSVLHLAVKAGNKALLRELVKAGADPNAKNDEGLIPIECAKKEEEKDIKAVDSMLCIIYLPFLKEKLENGKYVEVAEEIVKIDSLLDHMNNLHGKSELYLDLGKKIKHDSNLINIFTKEFVYKCFMKASVDETHYEEAQFELAEQYYVDGVQKEAYIHACNAGSYKLAIELRKKMAGGISGLVSSFVSGAFGHLDPMDPADSFSILEQYKEQRKINKEQQEINNALAAENKRLKEQLLAVQLTGNKAEGITFVYSTLFDNDAKNSNGSGKQECEDSKTRKRNEGPS